jgi:hypothetical protein
MVRRTRTPLPLMGLELSKQGGTRASSYLLSDFEDSNVR